MYPPPPRILQTPVDVKQKSVAMWSRNVDTEVGILIICSYYVYVMIKSIVKFIRNCYVLHSSLYLDPWCSIHLNDSF